MEILTAYEECSGQKVNFDKSAIFFSPSTPRDKRVELVTLLQVQEVDNLDNYLGLPTMVGKGRKRSFMEIVNRVREKVTSWSKRFLSMAGRDVFIKAVLQAVPQ